MRRVIATAAAVFAAAGVFAAVLKPAEAPVWRGAEQAVWTLDYAAALDSARSDGKYTLMLFTGSWWCPWCQPLEEKVLDTQTWKGYAAERGFYEIQMDYPKRDGSGSCWLYDEDYCASNGLTRAAAEAAIVDLLKQQGAYAEPDAPKVTTTIGKTRVTYGKIGYPTILVLRPDGSEAGRFEPDVRDYPTETPPVYWSPEAAFSAVTNDIEKILAADDKTRTHVTVSVAPGCEGRGSVTPFEGVLYDGKPVALKATAAKGFVFAGWFDQDEPAVTEFDYRVAVNSFVTRGGEARLTARFIEASEDFLDFDFSADLELVAPAEPCDIRLTVNSGSLPTVTFKGLPPGLSFDAKSLKIIGTAKTPGFYQVTATAKNGSGYPFSQVFTCEVGDLEGTRIWGEGNEAEVGDSMNDWTSLDFFGIDEEKSGVRTIAIKGQPSEIKYDATTDSFSGKLTKAGMYILTATVTFEDGVKETATCRFLVTPVESEAYEYVDFLPLYDLCVGMQVSEVVGFAYSGLEYEKVGVTKITGLPKGLSAVARPLPGFEDITEWWVEGTVAGPGAFKPAATVRYMSAETDKIVTETVSEQVIVADSPSRYVKVVAGVGGTVTGGGIVKPGATFKLTAKADKIDGAAAVFAGWYVGETITEDSNPALDGTTDYRQATRSMVATVDLPDVMCAKFVTQKEDFTDLAIEGLAGESFKLDSGDVFLAPFSVLSHSVPTLTAKGLPTGVTLTLAQGEDNPFGWALAYDPTSARKPTPGRYAATVTAKNLSDKTGVSAAFEIVVANVTNAAVRVRDEYGPYKVGIDIAEQEPGIIDLRGAVDFAAGETLSVAGLPKGLTFNKSGPLANTITGKPTTPGNYTLTFTAKLADRKTVQATSFVTIRPYPLLDVRMSDERGEAAFAGCKVTGGGNYAPGKSVTLKATAAKGWVFAGWEGLETLGLAALNPSLTVLTGEKDVVVKGVFIPVYEDDLEINGFSFEDGASDVCVLDLNQDIATWSRGEQTGADLIAGLISTWSWPTVTVKDLPTGIKFDAKTLKLSGKASKSGFYFTTVSAKNAGGYAQSKIVRFAVKDADGNVPAEPSCVNEAGIDFSELSGALLCTGSRLDEVRLMIPAPQVSGRDCRVSKVTVSGLPKGLSSTVLIDETVGSATVVVVGLPTLPGRSKLSIRVTAADRENPRSTKVLTSECWLIVEDGGSVYLFVENPDPSCGTLTGEGVYAAGATVKLTAKAANRDFVFAGWSKDEIAGDPIPLTGADRRSPTVSFPLVFDDFLLDPLVVVGTFVPAEADLFAEIVTDEDFWRIDPDADCDFEYWIESYSLPKITLKGLPKGVSSALTTTGGRLQYRAADRSKLVPGYYDITIDAVNQSKAKAEQKTVTVLVPAVSNAFFSAAGLYQGDDGYPVQAGMDAKEALASLVEMANGLLARGLKVTFKNLPRNVQIAEKATASGKMFEVSGISSVAGFFTATVSATGTDGISGVRINESAQFFIDVAALPSQLVGTFNGFVTKTEYDEEIGEMVERPCGAVVVTAKSTGDISAKVTRPTGTFSLTAKSWDAISEHEGQCMLVGPNDRFLAVTVNLDASVSEMQMSGGYQESQTLPEFGFAAQRDSFADDETAAAVAEALAGTFKFKQFSAGDGKWVLELDASVLSPALAVTIKKGGVAAFVGALVDGAVRTRVSGSTTVILEGEDRAVAQLVSKNDAESVLIAVLGFERDAKTGTWSVSPVIESMPGCRVEIYKSDCNTCLR